MTGHDTYFDYVNSQKWKTACSNGPQKEVIRQAIL
jgi:hypothetical protein